MCPGAVEQPGQARLTLATLTQLGKGEGLGVAPLEVDLVFVSCLRVHWYWPREKRLVNKAEGGGKMDPNPLCPARPYSFPLVVGNPYLAK